MKKFILIIVNCLILLPGCDYSVKKEMLPIPDPPVFTTNEFIFGVWMQSSIAKHDGITVAQQYKNIGINTYMGLWQWPSEAVMYSGWAEDSMEALKNAGLKVFAGNDKAAVDWINSHPEYDDTFLGYLLGDEPDMFRNSGDPAVAEENSPIGWHAFGSRLLIKDSTRPVYANFGKPFAKDVWYSSYYGSTGSQASDCAHYVAPISAMSSDFYGITDPWELPENHGIWTYGRAVRNTIKYADGKPVWGFVEASAPWHDASSTKWMFQRMQADLIGPIVWNMVVNGAVGVVYFCHDFSPDTNPDPAVTTNLGSYAALLEPGMKDAIQDVNAEVKAYEDILLTPTLSTVSSSAVGGVDVITLAKQYSGSTYIFAMGDGNTNFRDGQAVHATITVAGEGSKTVTVLNKSGAVIDTISMNSSGVFEDDFTAYEVRIYRF